MDLLWNSHRLDLDFRSMICMGYIPYDWYNKWSLIIPKFNDAVLPDSPKGPPCQAPLRWPSEPTDPEVDFKITQIAGVSGWGLDIHIWWNGKI